MPRAYPLLLSMYSTASHVPHFGFPIRLNSRTVPARLGLMLCKSKSPPDKPWDCYRGSVEFELSRRSSGIWITTLFLTLYDWPAKALGDATVSIKDVTPDISLPGELPVIEEQTVKLFEKSTYCVVNVFDVTLQPQVNFTGSVDVPEGNGTGIVWDKDGHIVTNFHVIASALSKNLGPGKVVARTSLLVQDGFQKTFQATLVGADKTKDLAVLKVDAPAEILHPITLGQSSGLKVGQRCLAIGNPFGFDHTLTVGVISGLNRDIFSQTGVVIGGGIQTDASINPGNSGGPLLNSKGELIGINTAIFTRTGTSSGVGFAIPVEAAKKIVPQLIKFGKVVHAGLNAQFAPDVVAKQLNIKSGALVLSLPAKSEVAKAGLMATRRGLTGNIVLGDIVIAVNGTPVKNPSELSKILDEYQVGDDVVLKIQRDGKIVDLGVVLEETAK